MIEKTSQPTDFIDDDDDVGVVDANLLDPDPNLSDYSRAKRLKEAIRSAGGSKQVAARIGIHPNSFSRYFKGRDPQSAMMVAIADACGVSVEWLTTGRGERHGSWITARTPGVEPLGEQPDGMHVAVGPLMPIKMIDPAKMGIAQQQRQIQTADRAESVQDKHFVPLLRLNVRHAVTGEVSLIEHEQIVEYYAYDEGYIRTKLRRRPENLILVEARGDSMEPAIRHGDLLTVDAAPDQLLEHAQMYVFNVNRDLIVKRVERRLTAVVLHSENPRYAPETVPNEDVPKLHVLGQVVLVSTPPR